MDLLATALLGLTAGAYVIWALDDAERMTETVSTEETLNSNELARTAFLELLDEAERRMIVYDDGDGDAESIYQSEVVVGAVQSKLDVKPRFRLKCVFNSSASTLFKERFKGNPRVEVRLRRDSQKRIHYKIIDGRKAYVSHHAPGSQRRAVKMITCRRPLFGNASELDHYFEDFRGHA